ncbi:hypothetical protein FRC14_004504 [Serendipita sp. 396]|nr:hypothetical protein FRC14_004504 [Serendipita sp. 396]KAG8788059.1 hypothetical protein FRC15_006378 [Serendipita sp. 397]KAG8826616.1 hypothetical protein FRC19_008445 [Serendipita sp. 401]KAG8874140.1 hypothetical protein FRC20_006651 [Serendipita sp. 405]
MQMASADRIPEAKRQWNLPFLQSSRILQGDRAPTLGGHWALVVLNQSFSRELFDAVWYACEWRVFADGGSNRVFDLVGERWQDYLPDLITGDLDSIRPDVQQQYVTSGVKVLKDNDLNATDLMKCFNAIQKLESILGDEYSVIVLGGVSGRLDHSVHTMSYIHKLRKVRRQVFVITNESIAWVLDEGEHIIHLDRSFLGPTCGLLPIGVASTVISMTGLKWNWTDHHSSFDGDVSTSNWLANDDVWVKTTNPIWWTIELRLPPASKNS